MTDTNWIKDNNESVRFTGPTEQPKEAANDRELYQTLDVMAELGYECHRAWESIIGEKRPPPWEELRATEKDEIIESVKWLASHPTSSISAQHDAWRARMVVIDPDHPNLVPFDELPFSQQMKARLWRHIIFAIAG